MAARALVAMRGENAAPRRGAVSVGAHSAIIFEYKGTRLSPESKEKPLRGAQALLQPRARAEIPSHVCQSQPTHAMAAQALVARRGVRPGAVSAGHSAIISEYKRTMLSPESDEKPLRGGQPLLQPRARAQIPC